MKTIKEPTLKGGGDLVLQEIWRIKDELSAARGQGARQFSSTDEIPSKKQP